MKTNDWDSLLIDYIDQNLSVPDREKVEQALRNDAAVRLQYEQLREVLAAMEHAGEQEPPARLTTSFHAALQAEIHVAKQPRTISLTPALYRVAAAVALLILGGGVGFWISRHQQQQAELEAMQREMKATKDMLFSMLDNDQSASQRLQGATVALRMDHTDKELVTVLVRTLTDDPNTNVRLAALDALGKFGDEKPVRQALIKALSTQNDPLVQIALIRMLVDMKEKTILKELHRISTDEQLLNEVKDEAHAGILRLS
jgi:HEAT repeat protein